MMAVTHSTGGKAHTKPSSVEQIVKRAQQIDYKPLVPLRYWLRSAKTLLKEVCETVTYCCEADNLLCRPKSTNVRATTNKPISCSSATLSLY